MTECSPAARRLFAGIELDAGAREACAAASEALQKTGFAARYERAEKLHVTLAFLGNVDASRCDWIVSQLASVGSRTRPFAVTLDKLGAFPHERKPRVVYVGAREQGAAFRSLARGVRDALAALGRSSDEDPVAHVTIARAKDRARSLPLVEFAPIELRVASVTLFESLFDQARNTSRYEVVARIAIPVSAG